MKMGRTTFAPAKPSPLRRRDQFYKMILERVCKAGRGNHEAGTNEFRARKTVAPVQARANFTRWYLGEGLQRRRGKHEGVKNEVRGRKTVAPAQAGAQFMCANETQANWAPAFAGATC